MEPYVYVIVGLVALAMIVGFVFNMRSIKKIEEDGRPPITKKWVIGIVIMVAIIAGVFVMGRVIQ